MPAKISGDESLAFNASINLNDYRAGIAEMVKLSQKEAEEAVKASQKEEAQRKAQIGIINNLQAEIKQLNELIKEEANPKTLIAFNGELEALEKELAQVQSLGKTTFVNQAGLIRKAGEEATILRNHLKNATSTQEIARYNKELERLEKELATLGNAGKKGYDNLGRPLKEQLGIIQKLEREVQIYQRGLQQATRTDNVEKYNRKLQDTQAELDRVKSIGKAGFDSFGKPLKEQIGLLGRLQEQAKSYREIIANSTDTATISKYNKKLQETENHLTALGNAGKKGFDEFGNSLEKNERQVGGFKSTMGNLAAAIGITFGVQQLVEWGRELAKIGIEASGVERAFAKIGDSGYLAQLRKETKGFVSDLDLQKLAVQANNLNIPLKNLGTFLLFASERAKETGKSVDQLTEDIINGLGRESKLVIDNLGISQKDLNAEIGRTGNFTEAVSNLIQREMGEAGVAVDTVADKANRAAVSFKNFFKELGVGITGLFSPEVADNEVIGALTAKGMKQFQDFSKAAESERASAISRQKALNEDLKRQYESLQKAEAAPFYIKQAAERLQAGKNILANLKEQNLEAEKQEQILKGIVSINYLQEKLQKAQDSRRSETDPQLRESYRKEAEEIQRQIDEMEGVAQKERDKKAQENYDRARDLRKKLLAEISEIDSEYAMKSLSQDEQELQALRNKFTKIKSAVEEFNRYNPKMKVGSEFMGKLDDTQAKAEADLIYSANTERIKIFLAEQKALYKEFEEYRATFGEQAAKERYENEEDMAISYYDQLKNQIKEITAIPEKDRTAAEQKRLKDLIAMRDAEKKEQEKTYTDLLASLQNYEQQRLLLTEKYERERAALGEGNEEAKAELYRVFKKNTDALNDAAAKELPEIEKLFKGIDDLVTANANEVVQGANLKLEELVALGKISADFADEIRKLVKSSSKAIADRLPKELSNLANDIIGVANAVGKVDAGFGAMLGTVGSVLRGTLDIRNSLASIKEAQTMKGVEGMIGTMAGVGGMFGATVGIVQSIFSLFDNSEDRAKEQQRREEERQLSEQARIRVIEAQTKALNRQLDLIKDLYGTERLVEYGRSLDEINRKYAQQTTTLKGKVFAWEDPTRDKYLKGLMDTVNSGKQLDPIDRRAYDRYVNDGTIKTIDSILAGLKDIKTNSKSIEDLQKLLDMGVVDETMAASIRAVIEYGEAYKKVFAEMKAELTGTSVNSLVSELSSIFQTTSPLMGGLNAFGKKFEQIMKTSIIKSFERQFLEKQMQEFYDAFYEASKDDLTPEEMVDLKKLYDEKINGAIKGLEELQKTTGINLSDDSGQTGYAGQIKAEITEDTGGKLLGQFGGLRLHTAEISKDLKDIKSDRKLLGIEMLELTMDLVKVNYQIEYNTRLMQQQGLNTNATLEHHSRLLANIERGIRASTDAIIANGG